MSQIKKVAVPNVRKRRTIISGNKHPAALCSPAGNPNQGSRLPCKKPCSLHTTCANCTGQAMECMWCSSARRCVDSTAYVISFPYGQCLEWQTGDCLGERLVPAPQKNNNKKTNPSMPVWRRLHFPSVARRCSRQQTRKGKLTSCDCIQEVFGGALLWPISSTQPPLLAV